MLKNKSNLATVIAGVLLILGALGIVAILLVMIL